MPVSQSNRRLLESNAQSKLQEANLAIRSASLRIYIAWQLLLFAAVEYVFFLAAALAARKNESHGITFAHQDLVWGIFIYPG